MSDAKDDADDRWFAAIPAGLALVLIVLGAMLIGINRHENALGVAMKSWPSTTGTVVRSGFRDERQNDGRVLQYADTKFRYEVDGHSYEFGTSEYAGYASNQHYLHYHPKDAVRIYYDPKDPSDGSLTNERSAPIIMLVLGVVLCALSLPFWYLSARVFRKRP